MCIDRYYAYHQNIFYIASSKDIKMFHYEGEFELDGTITHQVKPEEIETITNDHLRDMRIHGLFLNHETSQSLIIALETVDNQVDFNLLKLKVPPGSTDADTPFDFEFR